jgi:hypothetical protein
MRAMQRNAKSTSKLLGENATSKLEFDVISRGKMTGLPIDRRFENHKNGYKAARLVRKYGVRLMPELYAHLNPMPFEAAAEMEKDLAEDLRHEGYTVAGGT